MDSYSLPVYGEIDNFSPPGTLGSSVPIQAGFNQLNVANGNVQGDFSRPNPFAYRKFQRLAEPGRTHHINRPYNDIVSLGPQSFWGHDDPFSWSVTSEFSSLREICLSKIMGQVRGGNQIVVDLAEASSTIAMFRRLNAWNERVSEILGIIHGQVTRRRKHFERLDRRDRVQRILDFATSRWLEARYGWYPVAQSLYDALDLLHRENLGGVRRLSATASRPIKGEYPCYYSTFIGTIPGVHRFEGTERCRLVCEFFTPGAGIWDWTSLNPAVIAWELTPLSFVADWVTTIGQSLEYLENWMLWQNQFRGGYITYSGFGTETFRLAGSLVSGADREIHAFHTGHGKSSFVNRKVLTALPLPYVPRLRFNLNASRYMDATALVASSFRNRIRFGERHTS